jgi:hypothetical protein
MLCSLSENMVYYIENYLSVKKKFNIFTCLFKN